MRSPEDDGFNRRVEGLLHAAGAAWERYARSGAEADWRGFQATVDALLVEVTEHGRKRLRYLIEIARRDPGGAPGAALRPGEPPREEADLLHPR